MFHTEHGTSTPAENHGAKTLFKKALCKQDKKNVFMCTEERIHLAIPRAIISEMLTFKMHIVSFWGFPD